MRDIDEQYQHLIQSLREESRDADAPPRLDVMWANIEARAFAPQVVPWRRRWSSPLALAAMLLLGLGLGYGVARWQTPASAEFAGSSDQEGSVRLVSTQPTPFVGVAHDYLEQTTGLLIAVASDLRAGRSPAGTTLQARELLSTTRLLLDTGVEDASLRNLLEDLELVLAQLVRLPASRPGTDAALLTQTIDQRDVLPRLTVLLADTEVAP